MRGAHLPLAWLLTVLMGGAAAQVAPQPTGPRPTGPTVRATLPKPVTGAPQPIVLPPSFDRLRPVPVFWVFGQSNAEGAAPGFWLRAPGPSGTPYLELASQPNVKIWWPGNSPLRPGSPAGWENYVTGEIATPINNSAFYITENTFGTEASLGRGMEQLLGEPVFIFKFTRVAALHPSAQPSWSKSAGPGGLYDEMVTEWRRAADVLRAQGLAPDIRGLFWLHGEGDRGPNNSWAQVYADHLRRFVDDVRADLAGDTGADDGPLRAPFFIAAIHTEHQPPAFWDAAEALIRSAQLQVSLDDKNTVYIETRALGIDKTSSGWVHFDAEGYVRLGYEFVNIWWPLVRDR